MPEWGRPNRGTLNSYPRPGWSHPLASENFAFLKRPAAGDRGRIAPRLPTLERGSGAGEAPDVTWGRGGTMADVSEGLVGDELTEDELDELEALGAAEDADRILAAVRGEVDA